MASKKTYAATLTGRNYLTALSVPDASPSKVVQRGKRTLLSLDEAKAAKKALEGFGIDAEALSLVEVKDDPDRRRSASAESSSDEDDPLSGLDFTTKGVKDDALEAGLTAEDFEGVEKGAKSGYNADQVADLAEKKNAE